MRVCGRRRGHTFVPAAFAVTSVHLGGESVAPTQLVMNHFLVTAALACINTNCMRSILF